MLTQSQAGTSSEENSYKADGPLSPEGAAYAKSLGDTLIRNRDQERQDLIARGGSDEPLRPLTIWTSTRRRAIETASYLQNRGFKVRQRAQMSQLNPGVCEKMSEKAIRREYPDEIAKHEADPYHHRYPRAEVEDPPSRIHTNYMLKPHSLTMTSPFDLNRSFLSSSESETTF